MCLSQALIDRPDEVRRVENFKRLQLTSYKLDIPKLAKKKALKKALESDGRTNFMDCYIPASSLPHFSYLAHHSRQFCVPQTPEGVVHILSDSLSASAMFCEPADVPEKAVDLGLWTVMR